VIDFHRIALDTASATAGGSLAAAAMTHRTHGSRRVERLGRCQFAAGIVFRKAPGHIALDKNKKRELREPCRRGRGSV
jgi:hypothetical protein